MTQQKKQYAAEFEAELHQILQYWMDHSLDHENGGFYGAVHQNDQPDPTASKGLVLNARILWSFSAAYAHRPSPAYMATAHRAYQYLGQFFHDKQHGGYYWELSSAGQPLATRKQIYGQAFVIYALAEYYKITKTEQALQQAIDLYYLIEKHSHDSQYGGYIEATGSDWQAIDDLKLSAKDANEKKSMNTHLHVVEAYANLYAVWPNESLRKSITEVLGLFYTKIISASTFSQQLFFDESWQPKGNILSYGHDIEAAWLLLEAALAIANETLIAQAKAYLPKMVLAALQGMAADGGLAYETANNHTDTDRHWWVQAEAMVGCYWAYIHTSDIDFYRYFERSWAFTKLHIISATGEWHWGVHAHSNSTMPGHGKVGFWKCPYHNTRACLQLIQLLQS